VTDDTYASILGFHCWHGVTGLWYGHRLRSSPPVVLRADTLTELRDKINAWRKDHEGSEGYRWEPAPETY
jgi:hypothetical protein